MWYGSTLPVPYVPSHICTCWRRPRNVGLSGKGSEQATSRRDGEGKNDSSHHQTAPILSSLGHGGGGMRVDLCFSGHGSYRYCNTRSRRKIHTVSYVLPVLYSTIHTYDSLYSIQIDNTVKDPIDICNSLSVLLYKYLRYRPKRSERTTTYTDQILLTKTIRFSLVLLVPFSYPSPAYPTTTASTLVHDDDGEQQLPYGFFCVVCNYY